MIYIINFAQFNLNSCLLLSTRYIYTYLGSRRTSVRLFTSLKTCKTHAVDIGFADSCVNCGRLTRVADIGMLYYDLGGMKICPIIGRNSDLFDLLDVFRHGSWYRTVNVMSHHVNLSLATCVGSFH